MDLEKLANVLGADTVKKIYEDAASEPMKEGSKVLVDFLKAARLFTAPIQLLASYQDRLTKYLNKVREGVPEERQMEAPASISGPILDRIKYLDESNYLTNLYLTLLQKAIDKEKIHEAHPAFFHLIDQLSPDEAMILHTLDSKPISYNFTNDLLLDEKGEASSFGPNKVVLNEMPKERIIFWEHFEMYISHLESLNLVRWPQVEERAIWEEADGVKKQTGVSVTSEIKLTKFGRLFVTACIPKESILIINR